MSTAILQIEKKKTLVPKLRFNGFEGEWKEDLFGKYVIHSAFGPRFSSDLYGNKGNIATLRTTDMDLEGNICYETMPLANLEFDQIKDHILESNDIVISRSGTIGITGVFKNYRMKVVPGAFLIRFRVDNQKISTDFVKYQFNSTKGRNSLNTLSAGGVQKNLTGTSVKQLEIIIPTLPEQKKIASFLSAVDEKIQQLTRKKELLEQYKKGVMQQMFSGKLRFKDENGKDYVDWEEKRLGDFCTFFSGGTPTSTNPKYYSGTIPFIGSGNIYDSEVFSFISEVALNSSSAKIVEKGDLLYALYGANSGELAISKINGAINQAILCIRNEECIEYLYYVLLLNKDNIVAKFLQGGQGNLSAQIIKRLKYKFPSIKEQQKIADFLSNIDAKIETTNQQINQTQSFKKGLLQQMFV